jgi:hypothetical protein
MAKILRRLQRVQASVVHAAAASARAAKDANVLTLTKLHPTLLADKSEFHSSRSFTASASMAVRLVIGAVVAAVAMFLWGFVFWGLLPVSKTVMRPLPNEAAVVSTLQGASLPTAVYFYPFPEGADADAMALTQKQYLAGPIVELRYRAEGAPMMDPTVMAKGFLHFLAATLLVGAMLGFTLPAGPGFGRRWAFVFLFGLTAAFFHDFSGPIWFFNPWDFGLLNFGYHVVGWLIGGLVLAFFLKPAPPKSAPA